MLFWEVDLESNMKNSIIPESFWALKTPRIEVMSVHNEIDKGSANGLGLKTIHTPIYFE
jgi:hypothetical protein